MNCTFTLSRADFLAFQKVVNRRILQLSGAKSKLLLSNFIVWMTLGFAIASYAALFRKYPRISHDLTVVGIAVFLGAALLIAQSYFKLRIHRNVMLDSSSWLLSQQTAELDPGGVTAKGTYGEVRYPWSSFRDLVESDTTIYLFLDNTQAFILPKAALGSHEGEAQVKAWFRP